MRPYRPGSGVFQSDGHSRIIDNALAELHNSPQLPMVRSDGRERLQGVSMDYP
jgi:hypothetical protein